MELGFLNLEWIGAEWDSTEKSRTRKKWVTEELYANQIFSSFSLHFCLRVVFAKIFLIF